MGICIAFLLEVFKNFFYLFTLERYSEMVRFWDDVYGLKMTSMRPEVLREASIETVPVDKILSDPSLVLQLDLKTCTSQETEFFRVFQLKMTREDKLTALVGSFDVTFHLDHTVLLSTSPYSSPTHWKQTVFYLPEPITVHTGKFHDGICSLFDFLLSHLLNIFQDKFSTAVSKFSVTVKKSAGLM